MLPTNKMEVVLPENHHEHDTSFIIKWIDKLPTSEKLRKSVVDRYDDGNKHKQSKQLNKGVDDGH